MAKMLTPEELVAAVQLEKSLDAARAECSAPEDANNAERMEVIQTLLRWAKRGLVESGIQVRAPSGAIIGEYASVSDVPHQITDPRTRETCSMRLEYVDVVYRLVKR